MAEQTVDLWAEVGFDHLPTQLVDAFHERNWQRVRPELQAVMDGVVTDGEYGRELLQLVLALPIGIDPLFDRYRAMVSCDFGDWDGLQRCLDQGKPSDPLEIVGLRDIILAPLSNEGPPPATERHHELFFRVYEAQFGALPGAYLRWARDIQHFRSPQLWARGDMPPTRHARYRQMHDLMSLAIGEAQAGRLPVALSFAIDGQRVGNEEEPFRTVCVDLEPLISAAMGDSVPEHIQTWDVIRRATGLSPLASWQAASYLLPLIAAARLPSLAWGAELSEHIAAGLASPRAHLMAEAWKVAARFVLTPDRRPRELPGLLAQSRSAGPGLKVLPELLRGIAEQRTADLMRAERLARRVRNVWVQVSALTWATALSPKLHTSRRLAQLLTTSGWRRPVLVPPEIAAEAALGLVSVGIRGRAVVELAAVAARPNVTVEVARRHIEEPGVHRDDKFQALDALAALGTTHAHDLLRRVAARRDEVGQRATTLLARPSNPLGLSEREVEVLQLAGEGHTNREIGSRLSLSPHTIARHLANARGKLGASNRAEAAAKLATHRATRGGDRS